MLFWQWQAGEFHPCDSIPLADRGFRYGMSVFESFRVIGGKPEFLTEHLESLQRACRQVHFDHAPIPPQAIHETLHATALSGLARLYITAESRIILFIEERPPISSEARQSGYRLTIDPEPHRPLFGGLKTANYWANLSAFTRAREAGYDEALFCDEKGHLLSASLANLFIVKNGRLETPPVALGVRAGILRAWVATRRPLHERPLTAEDLSTADEIFLTSSWLGIIPAASLQNTLIPRRSVALTLQSELAADGLFAEVARSDHGTSS